MVFNPKQQNFSSMLGTSTIGHRSMFIRSALAEAPSAVVVNRKSLYEVLRVNQNASPMEIKAAYRTLAKLYHPDAASHSIKSSSSDGNGSDFIEIHKAVKAYATLSDPDARAVYDSRLSVGSQRRDLLPAAAPVYRVTNMYGFTRLGDGKLISAGDFATFACG